MALTVKKLQSLTVADASRKLTDEDGIYGIVRTRKDNKISVLFRWRFRFEGKFHDFTCGTWPNDPLSAIRETRRQAHALLQTSKNPNIERQLERMRVTSQQKAEQHMLHSEAEMSVELIATRWQKIDLEKRGSKGRKDNGAEVMRSFKADVFPVIGSTPIQHVSKSQCMAILNDVKLRGSLSMANRLLADLSQFFAWCEVQGMITATPLKGVTKQAVGGAAKIRERVLSDDEILLLNAAMPSARLQESTEIALWVMLGTGCRVGEICRARWEHVAFHTRIWTIPSENAKNGKVHRIFLSDFVVNHFKRLHAISGQSPWCYPAENKDGTHVCLKSIAKQIHDRQRAVPMKNRSKATMALGLPGGAWTPHDLRRTAATLMARLKVTPQIIEKTLNHVENNKLIKIYQHHDWFEEQRNAWEKAGEYLGRLLTGKKSKVLNFPIAVKAT
jgi:integrase